MKFYRGLVDVGKAPVRHQIKRGYLPMEQRRDGRYVEIRKGADGAPYRPIDPMSAAEVMVLRHLHGSDSVTEMKEVGAKPNLSFSVERDRLETKYGDKVVEKIFGVRGIGNKLPREIEIEDVYMALEDRQALAKEDDSPDTDDKLELTGDGEAAAA